MSWVKIANHNINNKEIIDIGEKKEEEEIEHKSEKDIENIKEKFAEKYSIELFDIAFNIKEYCEEFSPDILKKTQISNIIEFLQDHIDYSGYIKEISNISTEDDNE